MTLTVEQFRTLHPKNREPEAWTAALNAILPRYDITSRLRLAAFLAQCGHESDDFTDLTENLNYSADAMARTWPNRYAIDPKAVTKLPNALAQRLARDPVAIANNCYAGRMGNGDEASGDGWRFRGYGLIQLTGRSNRTYFAKAIGQPLAEAEAYILTHEGAVESACWYWNNCGLNALADAGNILLITKRINGGTIGFDDRKKRYEHALGVLAA